MNFTHDKKPQINVAGLVFILVIHAVVGYVIYSGLGKRMVAKMGLQVETKLIEDVKPPPPKDVPPPPPPPEMKAPPPPFIPPVEVNVQQPPQPSPIANATSQKPASNVLAPPTPTAAAPAPGPAKSVHVPAVVNFDTCAKPEWPKTSLRNEETGTVTLQFTIGVDGRVIDSKVSKSSGFRDLDKAAQIGISKCRFKPGMTDGKPEQSVTQVAYVWTLE